METFNNTPEAAIEVTVSLRDAKTAIMLWKDWFKHLSNDTVWTNMPFTDTFHFNTNDEDMFQEAEAFANDFFNMCNDNGLEVTLREIECPWRD